MKPDITIAACSRAIEIGQLSGQPLAALYFSRARAWTVLGDHEKVFADYSQASRIDPTDKEALDRAFISGLSAGKVDEATIAAERILLMDKSNRMARLAAGVRALKQKNYTWAQIHIKQSIRGPITDLVAILLSGWASYGAGDTEAAVASIDKSIGPGWYSIFKDLHTGIILELAGNEKDAGARLERAYKLDDSMLRVTEAYARWLSRNKDAAAAAAVYEEFNKKLPQHPLVLEDLRETKAGKKLSSLVDSPQAGAAEALYGIGATLARRGGEDLAMMYLQLSLYLAPNHPLALLSLADLYESVEKKPAMAIKIYERMPASSPLKRNAQIQRAANLDADDRREEAIKLLKAVMVEYPNDLEAIAALGKIERGRKPLSENLPTLEAKIEKVLPSDFSNLVSNRPSSKPIIVGPQVAAPNVTPQSDAPICQGEAKRFSLLIGNQDYKGALTPLANPRRDTEAFSRLLCANGFTVYKYSDLDIVGFDEALKQFANVSRGARTALVYYSGHGFAAGGRNWLVPVDAGVDCDNLGNPESADTSFLQRRLVDLSEGVLRKLESSADQIVILDACRTDPIRSCHRGGSSPTLVKGLERFSSASGRLLVYATQNGQPARDSVTGSSTSPLMTAIVKRLTSNPKQDWLSAMGDVSREVAALTHQEQKPNLDVSIPPKGCLAESCETTWPGDINQNSASETAFLAFIAGLSDRNLLEQLRKNADPKIGEAAKKRLDAIAVDPKSYFPSSSR